jgi:hypothetical protein
MTLFLQKIFFECQERVEIPNRARESKKRYTKFRLSHDSILFLSWVLFLGGLSPFHFGPTVGDGRDPMDNCDMDNGVALCLSEETFSGADKFIFCLLHSCCVNLVAWLTECLIPKFQVFRLIDMDTLKC